MVVNIWRYSHFALAATSCLFVLLAAISGIILAFEPIDAKLQPYKVEGMEQHKLSQTIDTLKNTYDEILEIKIDQNQFVSASVFSMDEELNGDFYIDPITGKKIGDLAPQKPFFSFVTNLHRSLFLKSLGRIFVGIGSFLLLLIVITGSILVIKRQQGIRHFFSKIIKDDFAQYWHVVLGRWSLVPIFIVAFTGVYLSLLRFEVIPSVQMQSSIDIENISGNGTAMPVSDFPIFQNTQLKDVRRLEFPFSSDVTDFYVLALQDKELRINQKTGEVVETLNYPFVNRLSDLSFDLHTGSGSIAWSIVLLIAALNILFFMYSGALISYNRLGSRIRNKYKANDAAYIILIGSENGNTKHFGNLLLKSLLKIGQSVYLDDLNHVQQYQSMKHLIVITSTYGDGDPPANATYFIKRASALLPEQKFTYSVVGLGSLAYENYCGFALKVESFLQGCQNADGLLDPFLIHNKSHTSFQKWSQKWGEQTGLHIKIPPEKIKKNRKLKKFKVLEKAVLNDGFDTTFTLQLKPKRSLTFESGDLLAVYPAAEPIKREYSIGKTDNGNILLSIKLHTQGVCSQYLHQLSKGDTLKAELEPNKDFHLPKNNRPVAMISNGTGIAPFLGMLGGTEDKYLFWGGKTKKSFELYEPFLDKAKTTQGLKDFKAVFSREEGKMKYVQELVEKDGKLIIDLLEKGGTLMICGSVSMQTGVLLCLQELCEQNNKHLNDYQGHGQILMDCY